jgi:hypothetical protein
MYVGGDEDDTESVGEPAPVASSSGLTIAEAKAGLAATFGVDPSQIEITIKG